MGTEVTIDEGANSSVEPTKATPTATVDAIVTTLVSEKPDVQEHAIEQAEADAAANKGKDSAGNSFDPQIHAVNVNGTPRMTTRGAYALKRGKKPTTSQNAQNSPKSQSVKGVVLPGTQPAQSAKEQESRAAGVGAANLMFALMQGIGGAEWAPRIDPKLGIDEKLMMEGAHADAFHAWGWGDLPPGLALAAAYCMYALPRLQMPATKTRMQRFRVWMGSKIGAWRASRKAKKRGFPETDVERADRDARAKFERERDGV